MRETGISSIKRRAVLGLAAVMFSAALAAATVPGPGAAHIAQPGPPWGNSSITGSASALA